MQEDKDAKIIMDLMSQAITAPIPTAPPAVKKARKPKQKQALEPKQGVIYIAGDGNVVAGGGMTHNVTHIHHHKPARPRVVVKTADGVIDAAQKAEITRLKDEWMSTHNAVKQNKLTHQAAWGSFNRAMKVSGYAELKPDQFEAACKWLHQQIGRLNSMASAARKVPGHNNKRIGAIKARCKLQLGDEFAYRAYILKNFGKTSLAELDVLEMDKTYGYIMGKR